MSVRTTPARHYEASAAAVRERIARCMLPTSRSGVDSPDATRMGRFTLRPDQDRTLTRIRAAITDFGGVLLADRPGTGKTVLALAVASDEGHHPVLVTAPAALREQWVRAAAEATVPITFMSLEALSRGAAPPRATLVIVDEAHHARTTGARRYARLAAACFDARVLLLTATPVVNTAADRDALLALFLGARSGCLTPEEESRCIVRGHEGADRPAVVRIGTIGALAAVPDVAEAIRTLPPPFPLTDGTDARALVVMTLAMAWRSSLAALDVSLRRRVHRGETIADILRSGGLPSREALRHWVLQDDSTQLAWHELLAPAASETARPDTLRTLERHLTSVRALRERIRPYRTADAAARAAAITTLADAHPTRRMVVFARHAETIRALYAALRHRPGVVALIGGRAFAAAGRWTRDEILRAIGPRARPWRADDPRAIRLVLATDVMAEGVEMQGVGIVVHADLPWTPARLEQRVGRVTRVGSGTAQVLEARLAAPTGVRALIRLGARLRRKRDAGRTALAAAAASARIAALLSTWREETSGRTRSRGTVRGTVRACVRGTVRGTVRACVSARREGFLAVLQEGETHRWLVGERRAHPADTTSGARWRICSSPRAVLRLLRAAGGHAVPLDPSEVRAAEHAIRRVLARRAARALSGDDRRTRTGPSVADLRIQRIRARLAHVLAHAPALTRPVIARTHAGWLCALEQPLEIERERRLDALLRTEPDDARFARRLGALLTRRTSRDREEPHRGPVRLSALLLLSPARPATAAPAPSPPSASPGSAAPR